MIRSFQWDLGRQVERLDWLIGRIPRYADWGYNEVHLHLEDAVEYPHVPHVARRDAFSYRQLERLVRAATRAGIGVVPIVNLLGHTQYLIKVPELRDLNELRAADGSPLDRGQICPLHPRTLELAGALLRDMAPFCTTGKVHAGLDESFLLGRCPRCRAEIARDGRAAHFAHHVQRLDALARGMGLRLGMWADMLYFLPDAIPLLPPDITAYEWYYHSFRRRPRVELFNFAEADLATPLRARGIARYGCPMNGAFRHEPLPHFGDRLANLGSWWRHARRSGAAGFLVSSWEPNRLASELTTAIDAAAASLWLEPEVTDPGEMLARGFERAFGPRRPGRRRPAAAWRRAATLALAADRYPFSGYPRWEINERWDTVSRREPLDEYAAEERHFARLAASAARAHVPLPLRASLALRHALAERDVCVRELGRAGLPAPEAAVATSESQQREGARTPAVRPVHDDRGRPDRRFQAPTPTPAGSRRGPSVSTEDLETRLAAALRRGVTFARLLWRRTRNPRVTGPNEQMLRRDEDRLRHGRAGRPVFGPAWQLCYRVWNFAPAAQLVGVEQQQPDGTWRVVQSCHTIEFQSRAARPRGDIVREHAAPVEWDGRLERPPRLRLFVRGVGAVKIGGVTLSDGATSLAVRGRRAGGWLKLGAPPDRQGLPDPDRSECTPVLEFA